MSSQPARVCTACWAGGQAHRIYVAYLFGQDHKFEGCDFQIKSYVPGRTALEADSRRCTAVVGALFYRSYL